LVTSAEKVTASPAHTTGSIGLTCTDGMGFTVITIALERERVWSEHPAVDVTTHVTTSPLLRPLVVKTLALGPTGTELMYH
jgi:hypothetical protein